VARREDVNIKFGPITDENLASALRHHGAEDIDIARMADELTQRRAADLTPEDVEALRFAQRWIAEEGGNHGRWDVAYRALSKLLGDGEGR
jgi:hypothetical protein